MCRAPPGDVTGKTKQYNNRNSTKLNCSNGVSNLLRELLLLWQLSSEIIATVDDANST